jgi:integrative and conjugative element protein (TIGR02256 family)
VSGVRFYKSWVDKADHSFIVLSPPAIRVVREFRQLRGRSLEAGGLLLGYRRGPHIEILTASTPGKKDYRSRYSFDRMDQSHQDLASSLWRSSHGLIHHVGEWHTHPEPFPVPSSIDERNWKRLAIERHPDWMVGVIVGQNRLWVGAVRKSGIEPFFPIAA